MRRLVVDHPKQWDQALLQAEFSYNNSPNRSTRLSPFHIVYGMNPRGIYELGNLGKSEMRSAYEKDFDAAM